MDPTTRFSDRVDDYVRHRPSYPAQEILRLLSEKCGLTRESSIGDMGSGTGLLAEIFCRNGNLVYGVEPNQRMRLAGEKYLAGFPNFTSIEGTAESSALSSRSVDLITAGQAFHWFRREESLTEFRRILRPGGWVVVIWNTRRTHGDGFHEDYEKLIQRYGTDYNEIRHEKAETDIHAFFAPGSYGKARFDNVQDLDLPGLEGRIRSSSYMPNSDQPNFSAMISAVRDLFDRHRRNGRVQIIYECRVHYGQLG